ncbi:MAG: hypothetical protein VX438_16305, partial [Planctomycetota bacterium]|nr:hypothetical protein [Planctomycetota bacterium]
MTSRSNGPGGQASVEHILGYLNFSSGAEDTKFLAAMNEFFMAVGTGHQTLGHSSEGPHWKTAIQILKVELQTFQQANPTFRDTTQANSILTFTEEFIPAYQDFHAVLLKHQTDNELFSQFFVARLFESVLESYSKHEAKLSFSVVRDHFDDYIGFRPVAVLESQKLEPYPKEWTRPIPI